MIAIVRINLLPAKSGRRVPGGQQILLLLMLVLVGEIAGLYMWSNSIQLQASLETKKTQELEQQIQKLKSIETRIKEKEKDKKILEQQNFIFDELKDDQDGPAKALLYLSYVLSKPDPDLPEVDLEIGHQQDNNWSTYWDPNRVWLDTYYEMDKDLEVRGQAMSHEDVTEFQRRLESSIYFYDVKPDVLEVELDDEMDELLVSFTLFCRVNYDMDGIPRLKSEIDASKKGGPHAATGPPGASAPAAH